MEKIQFESDKKNNEIDRKFLWEDRKKLKEEKSELENKIYENIKEKNELKKQKENYENKSKELEIEIEKFLKENNELKLENKNLKNDLNDFYEERKKVKYFESKNLSIINTISETISSIFLMKFYFENKIIQKSFPSNLSIKNSLIKFLKDEKLTNCEPSQINYTFIYGDRIINENETLQLSLQNSKIINGKGIIEVINNH